MNRTARLLSSIAVALILFPRAARSEDTGPALRNWSYTLNGGAMFPAGKKGRVLNPGPHVGGSLDYEMDPTLLLGADFAYESSADRLRTRLAGVGVHARLSPNQDLAQLYVEAGISGYRVSYDPKQAVSPRPESRMRFGGGFAIGYGFWEREPFTFGLVGSYRGVIMENNNALKFTTLGVSVSFRRSEP